MMRRAIGPAILAALACIALVAAPEAWAQTKEKKEEKKTEKKAAAPGQAEMEAAMAEWMKYAAPAEHHKHLEALVGSWNAKSRFWTAPDGPPMESSGKSESAMILGGRYLVQKFTGEMMGRAFEGMALTGYDNYTAKYTTVWVDNFGTMVLTYEGSCDGSGKVTTMEGYYDDPVTKSKKKSRSVTRVVGPDEHVFEMYDMGPDGKEFKSLEIVYTRAG